MSVSGGLTFVEGTRGVSDITKPLDEANLAFPVQAGSLYVSVTNTATGQRTLTQLTIDPSKQSLQDIASMLSSVGHIQGIADSQTGTLEIVAQPGYTFDFAGRLPSTDTSGMTGTAVPQVTGAYTGSNNDNYTFKVIGTGTVGVTPNLSLQVQNSAGTVIATMNIGQGYSPGYPLSGRQRDSGSARLWHGERWRHVLHADGGEPGHRQSAVCPRCKQFLHWVQRGNLAVSSTLSENPQNLAAGLTGQAGDGSNLQRMLAVQNTPVLNGNTQTLSQFYEGLVGDIGTQVQQLTQQQATQQATAQQLLAQQQSVSGVDPDQGNGRHASVSTFLRSRREIHQHRESNHRRAAAAHTVNARQPVCQDMPSCSRALADAGQYVT